MAVVATGFFDGVHLGHRSVLEVLATEAAASEQEALAVTFWPHPRAVLQDGARDLRLLGTQDEKTALLSSYGAGRVEVMPFSRGFASLSARQYIELLVREYGATTLVLGYDNRLGCDLLGPDELLPLSGRDGMPRIVVVPPVLYEGSPVSSTRIRKALSEGDVCAAAAMLGRPYELSGVVVGGKHLGRTIGFPTANIKLREPLLLIPQSGAYITEVEIPSAGRFRAMTNIDAAEKVESHILGFDEDIYGLDISIRFLSRLRDEMQFNSLDELRLQLEADLRAVSR